jgi:hypothetical protein
MIFVDRFAELSFGAQNFSVNLDRLGIDQDESDSTGRGAAIGPVVDRAALHDYIACFQMDERVVEFHVDLARYNDSVIDGVGPMVPARNSGSKLDDPKYRAVVQRRTDLAHSLVLVTGVIDGEGFRGPNYTRRLSGAA